jgi:RNA polymerase sigma-70 factor (ECF subfamily)
MQQKRGNQQWLDELCGRHGPDVQQQAHLDLANYLYVVAYNYLLKRQGQINGLREWAQEELAALAQDCVQDLLEKFAAHNFAHLNKYSGIGPFTMWSATSLRNQIATLLRRSPFTRRHVDIEEEQQLPHKEPEQQKVLERAEAVNALEDCLNQLSAPYRAVLLRCIGDGEMAQSVADALNKSPGAIYLIVMRAKRQVRACLEDKGVGPDVLALF